MGKAESEDKQKHEEIDDEDDGCGAKSCESSGVSEVSSVHMNSCCSKESCDCHQKGNRKQEKRGCGHDDCPDCGGRDNLGQEREQDAEFNAKSREQNRHSRVCDCDQCTSTSGKSPNNRLYQRQNLKLATLENLKLRPNYKERVKRLKRKTKITSY